MSEHRSKSCRSFLAVAIVSSLSCLAVNAHATPFTLNFNSQGYGFNTLENNGSFTWSNIDGSGVDLT